MKKIEKGDIIAFLIGAFLFGGIGVVVATGIASSGVDYTTNENNNVATVEDALDDLYTKARTYINPQPIKTANLVYKYWNDDYEGNDYYLFESPDDVYTTRVALETAYGSSNFADNPIYIRSAFKGNTAIYHDACFYHATTGKEFCLAPNYWVGDSQDQTDGATTKAKLKADMEAALGITIASGDCGSDSSRAYCDVGYFSCFAESIGVVDCYSFVTGGNCGVGVGGNAGCG